ncbi:MAG: type I-E CRISPR-associated protein Cse1/CasA [Clostridia bacterium]|nr:type I-E CRISPR-associated protein Cse1/CasA [Clostridia bacterium]
MAYSVLTEPVIPVLWPDGTSSTVGIREAFLRAHEIRDIQGETPLERYALLRLLIAFAMDMLHPRTSYDRRDLLDEGCFDQAVFDQYIALCEQDGPRFDLFDPDHPFMQSKYDEELDTKAEKPVASIVHSLPSGNNHVFIDHRPADVHELSPARAFHTVLASYLFCVSGTAGPSSINNTPPVYAIMVENSLFETIILNMLSEKEASPLPYGCGTVSWRKGRMVLPKEKVADVSLLEGLTWMPRRITLLPEENGFVRRVCCQAGLDFKGNDLWNDPHVPKFKKKDETFGTVKPELSRSLWRDAGTLMYDHDSKTVRQPQALRCLANIFDQDEIPLQIIIRAVGLITNQAAYTGWTEEELSIPSSLLTRQEQAERFRVDVSYLETMQTQIAVNVQKYVDRARNGSVGKEHEIATQCQQYFLHRAHDLLFGLAMDEICGNVPEKEHVEHFCEAVKGLLRETISQVLRASGSDAKAMMQQMEAEKWIWISWAKQTEERMKGYAGS